MRYQQGPKNIADALSRLVTSEDGGSRHSLQAEQYVRFVAASATPSAMTTREVEKASAEDEELSAIRKCIDGESWDQLAYKQYIPCSGELCTIGQGDKNRHQYTKYTGGTRSTAKCSTGCKCFGT